MLFYRLIYFFRYKLSCYFLAFFFANISTVVVAKGISSKELKRIDKAEKKLEKIIKEAEDFMEEGKVQKAIKRYKKAAKLAYDRYPDDVSTRIQRFFKPKVKFSNYIIGSIYHCLAEIFLKEGSKEESKKNFKRAKKKFRNAKQNLKEAVAFMSTASPQEEEEKMARIKLLAKDYAALGEIYKNLGKYDKAQKAYQGAIAFEEDISLRCIYYLYVGLCYEEIITNSSKLRKYENPLRIQYEGKKLTAYINSIELEQDREVKLEDCAYFKLYFYAGMNFYKVAAFFWNNQVIKKWLPQAFGNYTQKMLCEKSKKYLEKAYRKHEAVFGEKSNEEPQVATLASFLGIVYFHFQDYQKALHYEKKALEIRGKDPVLKKTHTEANKKRIQMIKEKMNQIGNNRVSELENSDTKQIVATTNSSQGDSSIESLDENDNQKEEEGVISHDNEEMKENLDTPDDDNSQGEEGDLATHTRDNTPSEGENLEAHGRDSSPSKEEDLATHTRDNTPSEGENLETYGRDSSPSKEEELATYTRDSTPSGGENLETYGRDNSPSKEEGLVTYTRDSTQGEEGDLETHDLDNSQENLSSEDNESNIATTPTENLNEVESSAKSKGITPTTFELLEEGKINNTNQKRGYVGVAAAAAILGIGVIGGLIVQGQQKNNTQNRFNSR